MRCSREELYTPPPPPIFGQKGIFMGGGGVYILKPPRQEFYTPPLFYTPPTPKRVFSGVGGWGCIKFSPVDVFLLFCFCKIWVPLQKRGCHNKAVLTDVVNPASLCGQEASLASPRDGGPCKVCGALALVA